MLRLYAHFLRELVRVEVCHCEELQTTKQSHFENGIASLRSQ